MTGPKLDYTRSIQSRATGCYNLLRVLLLLAGIMVAKCAFGQTLFRFYTAQVEIANQDGNIETHDAVMLVYAQNDTVTVLIPSTHSVALQMFGFSWISDGFSGLEGRGVNGWVKYREGKSGKSLEIKSEALWMLCRERKIKTIRF